MSRAIGVVRWRAAVLSNRTVGVLLTFTGGYQALSIHSLCIPVQLILEDRRGESFAYIAVYPR